MKYTLAELTKIVGGDLIGSGDLEMTQVLLDSRKIYLPQKSVFVAIKSTKRNGHDFVLDAYHLGLRYFLLSEKVEELSKLPKVHIIYVQNTLKALQQLASYHRAQFSYPVIGITGSNGKTIIKEWLYQLLKDSFNIVRSPKSYNSQIGVPLSIFLMTKEHDLAIFEAGISQKEEMEMLGSMIQPNIGIFANLGSAHDEFFKNRMEKATEKSKLFHPDTFLIYAKDFPEIAEVFKHKSPKKQIVWSAKKTADFQISRIQKQENHTLIQAIYQNDFIDIEIPFTDDASIENAIHCWITCLHLSIPHLNIKQKMQQLTPVAMRLEIKEGIKDCLLINDFYNSDWVSIEIALDFLKRQKGDRAYTVILSDIQQSGENDLELYTKLARLLDQKGVSRLIGIGPMLFAYQHLFKLSGLFFENTKNFVHQISALEFKSENILIKGARDFEFEQISKLLQKKVHNTIMEINLSSLETNLNYFKSLIHPKTKVMVMVKALAYGSGVFEIANLMQFLKVDYLAVAFVDEGIALRQNGISLPILVLNPEMQSYDLMLEHDLEPEIYNLASLNNFIDLVNAKKTTQKYKIHVKIDTGMHRLGFDIDTLKSAVKLLRFQHKIHIQSVFSHLAASDNTDFKDFTLQQINLFNQACSYIQDELNVDFIKHILNSSGISAYPEAQQDMVRLGIGLYGISAYAIHQGKLTVVSELFSTISQIKQLKAGDSVGYSRNEILSQDTTIATIPIGYADGVPRALGNRKGHFLVKGKKAPIVGNVCMDMLMLDVTGLQTKEGDTVEVFGKNNPVNVLANQANTIVYEIFTGISPRVKRVYFQE